ncbi:MFS transporter [Curtobacterium sp. PhB130]|uniref:MFS transporter n=1 Tax=Curtobacterium sp. PhB130 TaxID=2485178 RepID=UPI000F4CA7D6|nr:MFS transporter [Curtobacterium sp. PhB130]
MRPAYATNDVRGVQCSSRTVFAPNAVRLGVNLEHHNNHRWVALAAVLCATAMDLLDSTVMVVAAPSVQETMHGGDAVLQWLTAAYTLPFGILLILGGRLGDRLGRRRVFLVGAAGFVVASLACAFAPSIGILLAARGLQGAFGALLIPQGYGIVGALFRYQREQGRAFSLFGPINAIAGVGGPILAGALIGWDIGGSGWRAIFLINVPIGLFVLIAAARCLPRDDGRPGTRIDVAGAALVAVSAALLVFPLIQGRESGWRWWSFVLLALAVPAGWALVRQIRGSSAPILEPSLFGKPTFVAGLAVAAALFAGTGGLNLLLSLFLQLSGGQDAIATGLALAPLAIGIAVGAPIAARLRASVGRHGLHIGFLVEVIGLVLIATAVLMDQNVGVFEVGIFVTGLGQGLLFGPVIQTILGTADGHEIGSAAGAMTSLQQIAAALGISILGTVFLASTSTASMITGLAVVIALMACAALLVLRIPTHAHTR